MKKINQHLTFIILTCLSIPVFSQSSFSIARIVHLADSLKATLTTTQNAKLELTYSYDNARSWSNLPVTFVTRLGIQMSELSSSQKAIALLLIKETSGASSTEGYDEVIALFEADQYLSINGGGTTYGRDKYYLCFNGKPSIDGLFSIKVGGHHLQLENTYNKGFMVGATPHFIALEPLTFAINNQTYAPMQEERLAFMKVLANLTSAQLAAAKLSSSFGDIILGAKNMGTYKDWLFPTTNVGQKVGDLSTVAKTTVIDAIKTYVLDKDNFNAAAIINQYTNELDNTYIAYAGGTNLDTRNDYIRIAGPSVWIEFSVQNGIVLSGVHYHSIWRDRNRDYGGQGSTNGIYNSQIGIVNTSATFDINKEVIQSTINPNPISDFANFKIHIPQRTNLEINAYSVNGTHLALLYNDIHTAGEYDIPLDLQICPNGLILLQVKTNYGVHTVKLIKE